MISSYLKSHYDRCVLGMNLRATPSQVHLPPFDVSMLHQTEARISEAQDKNATSATVDEIAVREDAASKKHKGGYKQINKSLNICAFEGFLEAQLARLPEISDVEQVTPRVLRVLGQNAGKVIPACRY